MGAYGMHVVSVRYSPDLNFLEKFGAQFLMWQAWGIWSQLIFAVCDRLPFVRGGMLKAVAALVPLSALVVLGNIAIWAGVTRLYGLGPEYHWDSTIAVGIRSFGDVYFTVYWAVVGAHAALRWHEAWRNETVRTARLQADLAESQLHALRAQLNPHFLFNALNSVVTLIGKEPAAAQSMVVRLADLLRSTLALSSEQATALKQEIELAAHYLDIEQIRFQDKLSVRWEIDEATLTAAVPSLVLQPLVENAVVHGTSRLKSAGEIVVGAALTAGALTLTVRDNGPGPAASDPRHGTGIGIANLRARLERLYGSAASLTIAVAPSGGCLVTLVLPFTVPSTA